MGRDEIFAHGRLAPEPFIMEKAILKVKLINRVWGKRKNLICIFEKEDGELFSAVAWRKGHSYSPRKSDIDFSEVSNNTFWECEFSITRNGQNSLWLSAKEII